MPLFHVCLHLCAPITKGVWEDDGLGCLWNEYVSNVWGFLSVGGKGCFRRLVSHGSEGGCPWMRCVIGERVSGSVNILIEDCVRTQGETNDLSCLKDTISIDRGCHGDHEAGSTLFPQATGSETEAQGRED